MVVQYESCGENDEFKYTTEATAAADRDSTADNFLRFLSFAVEEERFVRLV